MSEFMQNMTVALGGLPVMFFASLAMAGRREKRPVGKGILLVAFGTSVPEAQEIYQEIDAAAKARFREAEVRWAFTSQTIRKKLAGQGRITLSPSQALAEMAEDGFTQVAVQSLLAIPGQEFHQLYDTVIRFKGMPKGIGQVCVGRPLMATTRDMQRLAEAILAGLPREREGGEAVVLMGHGTGHPGNVCYPAMNYIIQRMDPNVLVGTVDGYPDIEQIRNDLVRKRIKKAWLMPFMSVAGDHARNDMAGDRDESWKSILTKAGIECRPVLKGLAAYPQILAIWMDHLDEALGRLK